MYRIIIFFVVFMIFGWENPTPASDVANEQMLAERFWGILIKNPRRGTALDRVCDHYAQSGQMDSLLEKAENMIQSDPENAKAWLLAGLIHDRLGNDPEAINAYQKAMVLDTSDVLSPWYLGEILLGEGELNKAINALEEAKNRKPHHRDLLEIMQTLGRAYARNLQIQQATEVWKGLESLFPDDQDILVQIAEILEEEQQYDQALVRYEKLASSAQKSGEHYAYVRHAMSAADLKIKLGKQQDAIRDFEKLLDVLDDQNWLVGVIRDRIEKIFFQQRNLDGLIDYYTQHLDRFPNDLDTVRRLTAVRVRTGNLSEAIILLQDALEKAPSDVSLHQALIDLYVHDNRFDLIDREYETLNALEPNNPDHITQWGLAVLKNETLEQSQREQKAVRIWDKLITVNPNDAATLVLIGDLMASHGMPDHAERLYLDAVASAQDDVSYREYLAYFYHQTGQKEQAIESFRRMTEGDRNTSENLFRLARTFRRLGYADEALAVMREGVALEPDNFEMQRTYVELLIDFKQTDQARMSMPELETLAVTDEQFQDAVQLEIRLTQLSGSDAMNEKLRQLTQKSDPTAREFWKTAMFQMCSGRNTEAIAAMEKAMQAAPDSILIMEATADLLAKNLEPTKAIAIFETLMTNNPVKQQEYRKQIARIQLGTQNRSLGIETLRQIVRNNPSDLQSLDLLTKQILLTGETEDVIDLTWLAFDSLNDLQEKIGLVNNLTGYYKQTGRTNLLLERLREQAVDPAKRRETAYCLALVHVFLKDFHGARNVLEEHLHENKDSGRKDPSLLHQLSIIAEIQGDTNSAIKYQERLCEFSRQPGDRKRLLDLYCVNGSWDAAVSLIQRHTNLNESGLLIEALDHLLEREAWLPAHDLLDKWESTFPDNWELLYRKLQICYRLGEGNPDQIADMIINMNRPLDEAASDWGKTIAENATDSENRVGIVIYSRKTAVSTWWLGEVIDRSLHIEPGSPPDFTTINRQNQVLLQTVFGECLQLKPGPDGTVLQNIVVPAKPLFKPLTFADAKFAAIAWKMKTALDRDVVQYQSQYPEDIPDTIDSDFNPNADPFESRLASLVDQVRKSFPENSEDAAILKERLRFEFFWAQWTFDSIMENLPYSWFYYSIPQENHWQTIQKISVQLALSGEKEYYRSAFRHILESVEADMQSEFYRSSEINVKINKRSEAYLNQIHVIENHMAMNPGNLSVSRRLDWLVETLLEMGQSDPTQLTKMPFHYSSLNHCFPAFYNLLKLKGRDEDIDRITNMLRSIGDTGSYFIMRSLQSGREYSIEQDWLQKIGLAPDTIFENPPPNQLLKRSPSSSP